MADENTNTSAASDTTQVVADTKAAEVAANEAIKAAEAKAEIDRKAASGTSKEDTDMISKLVQDRLDTELSTIKKSLNNAYKQRDEALAKIAAQESKEKEANLKKLEEEGKHKEAYELRLAEERAKNEALQRRNTELSRDVSVRDALKGLTFRNDQASDMAFREITGNLVQNEQGQWVHRSGISIKDYCDAFSRDEDQQFLFKSKPNTGSGASSSNSGNGTATDSGKSKSLFAMSQAEVIKLASEGKLGRLSNY